MPAAPHLKLRCSRIRLAEDVTRIVLEVSAPAPPRGSLAIVFDQSDSCGSMHKEIGKLPKLLEGVPRQWPVWSYVISNPIPLDYGTTKVSDIQDGSFQAITWAEDDRHTSRAAARGSFIRPVIEAISHRLIRESLDSVVVLVLTDGECLDRTLVEIPRNLSILGLTSALDTRKLRHWQRVLPKQRLYTLSDPALDVALRQAGSPFYGGCELAWCCEACVAVYRYHVDSRSVTTLTLPKLDCNLANSAVYLIFDLPVLAISGLRLTAISHRALRETVVALSTINEELDRHLLEAIGKAFAQEPSSSAHVILDTCAKHNDFLHVWRAIQTADSLAENRARWVDIDQRLIVFNDAAFKTRVATDDNRSKWDAILCLCNSNPSSPPTEQTRIVLLGLKRSIEPPLRWHPEVPLEFGIPIQPLEIRYDKTESCWMIKLGDNPWRELDLNGSERLHKPILRDERSQWSALFSGDLTCLT